MELKRKLSRGRYMRMSDIDGAFTLLPLVPWLWKYMLFVPLRSFAVPVSGCFRAARQRRRDRALDAIRANQGLAYT